jgi:hypothetical protein
VRRTKNSLNNLTLCFLCLVSDPVCDRVIAGASLPGNCLTVIGVGPGGAAADEARADEDDEGGAHPEADQRGHQIQLRPQHLSVAAPLPAPAAGSRNSNPTSSPPPPLPAPGNARTRGLSSEKSRLLLARRRIRAERRSAGSGPRGGHRRGVWDLVFAWAAGNE